MDLPIKNIIEEYLSNGMLYLQVHTKHPEIDLPSHLEGDVVTLKISYKFPYADIEITETNISASLSFSGKMHRCVIPFESIQILALETPLQEVKPTTAQRAEAKGFKVIKGGKED